MQRKTKLHDEVRIVFDRYLNTSLKDQTREKRAKGVLPVRFQIADNMDITNISMTRLLSHKQTKNDLTLLFQKNIAKEAESNRKLYMHARKGKSSRVLDIEESCKKLGPRKCNALLGMHAFTGSDWRGKFSGITKRKWMKLFLELDDSDEILDALSYLDESLEDPNGEVIVALEKCVCRAYSPKTKCISLKKLRWELFRRGKRVKSCLQQNPHSYLTFGDQITRIISGSHANCLK
ncbi:hypothetical protein GQR58_023744 [Nymphon striatum]|nr:hypothetical protein GQR58_023744 [Nymphon striatum]